MKRPVFDLKLFQRPIFKNWNIFEQNSPLCFFASLGGTIFHIVGSYFDHLYKNQFSSSFLWYFVLKNSLSFQKNLFHFFFVQIQKPICCQKSLQKLFYMFHVHIKFVSFLGEALNFLSLIFFLSAFFNVDKKLYL